VFGHNNITVDNLETSETEEGELITGEVTVEILSPEVIVNETDTEEDLVLAIAKMDGDEPGVKVFRIDVTEETEKTGEFEIQVNSTGEYDLIVQLQSLQGDFKGAEVVIEGVEVG